MQHRTFLRIMMDNLIINNPVYKAIDAFVKFCNEQTYFGNKNLKFLENVPLNKNIKQKTAHNRFIFDSTKLNGVNYK